MSDAESQGSALPWVQTASGGAVDLVSPKPEQIRWPDVAIALARIPRFNGHFRPNVTWSVAAHSMIVSALVRNITRDRTAELYGLAHDCHEAFLGDVTSPMKQALQYLGGGTALRLLTQGIDQAIHAKLGLDWPAPDNIRAAVRHADLVALRWERINFLARSEREWTGYEDLPADVLERIDSFITAHWTWPGAERLVADDFLASLAEHGVSP